MTIGAAGAEIDDFGRDALSREFDELRRDGLIIFWPPGAQKPVGVVATANRPGTWCLTYDGSLAIGLDLPLFRTK